jgi:hypothetical protein
MTDDAAQTAAGAIRAVLERMLRMEALLQEARAEIAALQRALAARPADGRRRTEGERGE